jgi:phosphoenolpyruvate synthase/pyruvate phosphate dikinase
LPERPYVLDLRELDRSKLAVVGGKGANLGELSRIEGIRVPPGFCVTTHAFQRAVDTGTMPDDVADAITGALARFGEHAAYAVRSSATAEDSPTASFAGQHDSFLNVVGAAAILEHVGCCWASLFTERAVAYRLRHGIDHRTVRMAVVVQRLVDAKAAGVLFTADPVSGNRTISSIEAARGLGEALVSGRVNADVYMIRDEHILAREAPEPAAVLTDEQAVRLAQLGRRIEAHFGRPQDIEWCLDDHDFWFVQSRPITTLFPIPTRDDAEPHVYVSVGHQQMMTDAMKPLGVSFRQVTAATTFHAAGGRVFVDVTRALASPATRAGVLMLGKSDPLIGDALQTIVDRGDFLPELPDVPAASALQRVAPAPIETDPAIPAELMAKSELSVAALEREILGKSGTELLDAIHADFAELKRVLTDPRSTQVFMTAMEAAWWLNDHLEEWLGEKNVADTLTQSVANNITSEMGLALLDVADVIRPHAAVVSFLEQLNDDPFLDELSSLDGGAAVRDAIQAWLARYGMRGVGEIDITRPRWSERPSMLVPLLLGNVRNFAPGEAERRFERGLRAARKKEQDVLARLRALPDGERKADETKRMIDRVRTFIGYREYPKYGMMRRYGVYKPALMAEADRLVETGVLRDRDDIFWFSFEELQDVVRTRRADEQLIRGRREEFRVWQALTPPRVLTSDGEMLAGAYRRGDLPTDALAGLGVSAGTVEGRARVILDMAQADLAPGDILVTTFTDPSWTPLFVAIAGLVTEVGGLMTHGAVIAREYGLPAVVGVERATQLIHDGQRIRVHGTAGYVEILTESPT